MTPLHLKSRLNGLLTAAIPRTPFGDRLYGTIRFAYAQGRFPRYRKPQALNDYLFRLWVGPEASAPLRRTISDKHLVKEYIAHAVGSEYVVPTLDLLTCEQDVDRFITPNSPCVIKPTHASGGVLFLSEASNGLDKALLKSWLYLNYYEIYRERNYRNLAKRIIVEPVFSHDGVSPSSDYKVYCFQGKPKIILAIRDRFAGYKAGFYTPLWQKLPFCWGHRTVVDFPKPPSLEEMIEVAARVSRDLSFVRVDFLSSNEKIKIGELTNCPQNACARFYPRDVDLKLGTLFYEPDISAVEALALP